MSCDRGSNPIPTCQCTGKTTKTMCVQYAVLHTSAGRVIELQLPPGIDASFARIVVVGDKQHRSTLVYLRPTREVTKLNGECVLRHEVPCQAGKDVHANEEEPKGVWRNAIERLWRRP